MLIELLTIPFMIPVYYLALEALSTLKLGSTYFYLFLFFGVHLMSSALILISNYETYGTVHRSMLFAGMLPTLMSLTTFLIINMLPFLKWPWSKLMSEIWINPLIMGIAASFGLIIINNTITPSVYEKLS